MMLELVSDLLFGEAKAIVIIAQGFKIFMKVLPFLTNQPADKFSFIRTAILL